MSGVSSREARPATTDASWLTSDSAVAVSIVIVSYNTCSLLEACLASLRAQESGPAPPPSFEVVVVDNGSTDDSVRVVRERFPDVHLIQSETNRGFAAGNNLALPYCRGGYIMLLNADTVVEPGALTAMVELMAAHPEVGAVGPRLLNPDGTTQPSGHLFITPVDAARRVLFRRTLRGSPPSSIARRQGTQRFRVGECEVHDWLTGACLMVRRAVLAEVGPLDERFFFECEDVDWCRRIRAAGWEICLLPSARVIHVRSGSGIGFSPDALLGQEGHCYYFRRYHGRGAEALMRAAFTGFHILGWIKYGVRYRLGGDPGDQKKQRVHRLGIGYFLGKRA